MSTIATKPALTPDDLLAMPDGDHYELVDGNLVERNVSNLSSLVSMNLGRRIGNHCEERGGFWVFNADCGYQCFPWQPGKVRRADVSVVLRDRLTVEQLAEGYVMIPPDLAIEVVSPNDLAYEVDTKVREYLNAGVRLVWVINPETREARVHRANGTITGLREDDEFDGEDVIPGFRCRLGDLLPSAHQPAR